MQPRPCHRGAARSVTEIGNFSRDEQKGRGGGRKPCSSPPDSGSGSDRLPAALAGADADAVFQWQDENLAVADLAGVAGASGMDNGLDGRLHKGVIDGDLQL